MRLSGKSSDGLAGSQTWAWWEARRLRYNLALALAGWMAYGLNAAIFYAFNHPIWQNIPGAIGMTMFLGAAFLVLMGVANICYLFGAVLESIINPPNRGAFRRRAFAMGFWGSLAVPFVFPLVNLALLVARAA